MTGAERFRVGDYDCWALADGELIYPGSTVLPREALPPDQMPIPYTAMLVDTGSTRILIDTGAGALGPNTGKLLPGSLAAAGFSPEDIHTVVLSHGHADHIGAVARFPNAAIVMMRREYAFWTSAEIQAKLEAGRLYDLGPLESLMAASIRDHLMPAVDRLRLLEQPTEIAAGVLVFPAPGHTPGHAAVLISSRRQQLLYVGDVMLHPAQFEHPDWTSAFDLARDETVNTRKQLIDRAAADRCLLAGFHLPGAVGAVGARQARFRWEPIIGAEPTA